MKIRHSSVMSGVGSGIIGPLYGVIFPILRPAIEPGNPKAIDHLFANGVIISHLPNYYWGTTGHYYFPGLYTAILLMIPGIWGILRVCRWRKQNLNSV